MSVTIFKISYESIGNTTSDVAENLEEWKNEDGHFYLELYQINKLQKQGDLDKEMAEVLRKNLDRDIGGIEFIIG